MEDKSFCKSEVEEVVTKCADFLELKKEVAELKATVNFLLGIYEGHKLKAQKR